MGQDTKAIIRKDVSLSQIKQALEKVYGEVTVHSTFSDNYFRLEFKDGKDSRDMSVFMDKYALHDYKINGVLLSLGYWGNSVKIMKLLCNKFGGYLDINDCDAAEFEPINIRKFESAKGTTPEDLFKNKVISKLGYDKLNDAMELFNEFKGIYK